MDNIINLFNDNNFVSYPYLQSKKVFEELTSDIPQLDSEALPVPNKLNPFSIHSS